MIETVSQFLNELKLKEAAALDAMDIVHAPTIGAMYEGLSADLLERAIPKELGIQVVSGFIEDGQGVMSGQIDCMVVIGRGRQIPYTNDYVWRVKDVVAVFEIKKSLMGAEMKEAVSHLAKVKDLERSYTSSWRGNEVVDVRDATRAYAQITGRTAPAQEDLRSLPREEYTLLSTILSERLHSIRIVLGYDGFQTEAGFRKSMDEFIEKNSGRSGLSPGSLPHLIVSGKYSLVKTNGMPYAVVNDEGIWVFYCSARCNPVRLILEFVWTRLVAMFSIGPSLWGEDLEMETMEPFLSGHVEIHGDRAGWVVTHHVKTTKDLKSSQASKDWAPTNLTDTEAVIVSALCNDRVVDLSDSSLLLWLGEEGVDPDILRTGLSATGLVAFNGSRAELLTANCVVMCLPNGQWVASDDNTGRLSRWVERMTASHD